MPNSENKPDEAMKYLRERFGVKNDDLKGLQLTQVSGDVWVTARDETELDKETSGIRAVRFMDIGLKPTTYLLQVLGDSIENYKVRTDEDEFKALLQGDMIERELEKKGYVAITFDGEVFGCGFYMDELVSSRIPEGRAEELLGTF